MSKHECKCGSDEGCCRQITPETPKGIRNYLYNIGSKSGRGEEGGKTSGSAATTSRGLSIKQETDFVFAERGNDEPRRLSFWERLACLFTGVVPEESREVVDYPDREPPKTFAKHALYVASPDLETEAALSIEPLVSVLCGGDITLAFVRTGSESPSRKEVLDVYNNKGAPGDYLLVDSADSLRLSSRRQPLSMGPSCSLSEDIVCRGELSCFVFDESLMTELRKFFANSKYVHLLAVGKTEYGISSSLVMPNFRIEEWTWEGGAEDNITREEVQFVCDEPLYWKVL
jgi:hypothetical protein